MTVGSISLFADSKTNFWAMLSKKINNRKGEVRFLVNRLLRILEVLRQVYLAISKLTKAFSNRLAIS